MVAGCLLAASAVAQVGGDPGGDPGALPEGVEILENGPGSFGVSLPDGTCCDDRDLRSVQIDDLTIDIRETTTGLDVEYRVYAPGDAHYGNARFRVVPGSPASKELQLWWSEAAKGKNIRKNITVTLFKSDKSAGRTYNLHDCFPVSFTLADSTSDLADVLVVSMQGVDLLAADDADAGILAAGMRGLYATVRDPGAAPLVTALWRSWRGGEVAIFPRGQFTDSQFHTTTPGHKYVDTITLRGPMTSSRKSLCTWINDTVNGKPWKRSITVTEITRDGGSAKRYNYFDCFPVRYVFPRMSVDPAVTLKEEVSVKPIRVELR